MRRSVRMRYRSERKRCLGEEMGWACNQIVTSQLILIPQNRESALIEINR